MTTGTQKNLKDPDGVASMKRERALEARAAAWIESSGVASVYMAPEEIRPDEADPVLWKDKGDLEVRLLPCVDPGDHRVVSVKHNYKSDFTSAATFRFPFMVVGFEGNYDPEDLPVAVFIWNKGGTHFAIVHPEATYKHWLRKPVKITRATGFVQTYTGLFCPKDLVTRWVEDTTPDDVRRRWYVKAGLL